MTKYYIRKIKRLETVVQIISSTNMNKSYIIDSRDIGKIRDGELIHEVRLGDIKTDIWEELREASDTELAILTNIKPKVDPMANEYGKSTDGTRGEFASDDIPGE